MSDTNANDLNYFSSCSATSTVFRIKAMPNSDLLYIAKHFTMMGAGCATS